MRYLLILLSSLTIISCADYKIKSSVDPDANFSDYKSWCWMNECNPSFEGPGYLYERSILENMVNAIAEEMYNKGYDQLDNESDLLVDFHVVVKQDSTLSAVVHEEMLTMWEQYDETDLYYHYLVGTLIINIADRKKGQIIWQSITEKYLPTHPDMSHTEVKKGIKKALKDFPEREK